MNKIDKAELLSQLNTAYTKVSDPVLVDSILTLKQYTVRVFQIDGDVLQERNLNFYVNNEGETTERAFYKSNIPLEILKAFPF